MNRDRSGAPIQFYSVFQECVIDSTEAIESPRDPRTKSPGERGNGQGRAAGRSCVIQCLHLWKTLPGGRLLLREASLDIEEGEMVFLLGPAASGKTTLIRCILGLDTPEKGQVLIRGRNLAKPQPKRLLEFRVRTGLMLDDLGLIPDRTVAENVALPLRIQDRDWRVISSRVSRTLRFFGLETRGEVPAANLSACEQRLVTAARMVAADPPVILADDPLRDLPGEAASLVTRALTEAHMRGASVLVTTRDHSLPERFAASRVFEIARNSIYQPLSNWNPDPPQADPWD